MIETQQLYRPPLLTPQLTSHLHAKINCNSGLSHFMNILAQ